MTPLSAAKTGPRERRFDVRLQDSFGMDLLEARQVMARLIDERKLELFEWRDASRNTSERIRCTAR